MRTLLFAALFSASALASAVCYHNGEAYQTGERVGQYVCTADGSWRRV